MKKIFILILFLISCDKSMDNHIVIDIKTKKVYHLEYRTGDYYELQLLDLPQSDTITWGRK